MDFFDGLLFSHDDTSRIFLKPTLFKPPRSEEGCRDNVPAQGLRGGSPYRPSTGVSPHPSGTEEELKATISVLYICLKPPVRGIHGRAMRAPTFSALPPICNASGRAMRRTSLIPFYSKRRHLKRWTKKISVHLMIYLYTRWLYAAFAEPKAPISSAVRFTKGAGCARSVTMGNDRGCRP